MGAFSSSSCSGPVALPRTESSPPRAESAEDSGAGLGGQQALQMRFLRRRSPSRLREAGAEGEPPPRSWSPQDWRQGDPEAAVAPGEPLPGDKPSKVSQGGGADGKAQMRGAWLTQPPKLCAREHEADSVPGTHGRGRAPHLCTSPGPGTSEPCVPASFNLAPETPSFQSRLLLQLNELKHLFHSFH